MLIGEYPGTDCAALRRDAAACAAGAELYLRDDGTGSLIVCQAGRPAGAAVAKDLAVLFTGGQYGTDGGEWLFLVGLWTPEDFRDEFVAWYRFEHLPILLECRTWDGCRFAEQRVDAGCQFYAMHQLSDRAALDSAERKYSRATPWFQRWSRHPWFDGAFERLLYKRVPG